MFLLDVVAMNPVEEFLWEIERNPEKILSILAIATVVVIVILAIKRKR